MTRSAIDEDGSHHQLPYWDYFKANRLLLNQDKLKVAFPFNVPNHMNESIVRALSAYLHE